MVRLALARRASALSEISSKAEAFLASGKRLYVDMDGVICDFVTQYINMGGNKDDLDGPSWSLDEKICGNPEFWSGMPWMPGSKEMLEALKPLCPVLLTAGWDDPECMAARSKWFVDNIGYTNGVAGMLVDKEKTKYASGGSILIDDYTKNTVPWEGAGGFAILHTDPDDTLSKVSECLADI